MSESDIARTYVSPFSARYASEEMSSLFSPQYRIELFRKLWIALAKAEKKLGLPITTSQIREMEKALPKIDCETIARYEKKFRHDVWAHIQAFGDLCPKAKPIIHLGATSTFVTDNADLIQMREALKLLFDKLIYVLHALADFAKTHAASPCLGFTHFQSAQPTTIGKRAATWLQDFLLDAKGWEQMVQELPLLGAKGAVGTQSSFLSLFAGDATKVQTLEKLIAEEFGFQNVLSLSGQTYTRKLDLNILNAFESFAASAHKMATDIRLLAHDGEMSEGFEKGQVGSSAMPYKKNPIYAERICGIARFVMSLAQNPAYTTATQWLERSLDDSSNKRLAIPEAFLGMDTLLNLLAHLVSSLKANKPKALDHLKRELPLLVMENILMASVKKGADRQEIHEKLRGLSSKAPKGKDLLQYLMSAIEKNPSFRLKQAEIKPLLSVKTLIGLAPEQTHQFLRGEVHPFLRRFKKKVSMPPVSV